MLLKNQKVKRSVQPYFFSIEKCVQLKNKKAVLKFSDKADDSTIARFLDEADDSTIEALNSHENIMEALVGSANVIDDVLSL